MMETLVCEGLSKDYGKLRALDRVDLRLEEGKIADMVILSANPYTTPKEELIRLNVEELILQGKPYQPQKQSVPEVVLKGMLKRYRTRA